MRCSQRDRAACRLVRRLERVGKAFAVVVVGVCHGNRGHAFLNQKVRKNRTLTRVGRGCAEEQTVVFGFGQRRRCCGRRDHDHPVRYGDVGQNRAGHARAIRAHDAFDPVRCNQALRSGCGCSAINACAVGAHRRDFHATHQSATFRHFSHRHFGTRGHRRRQGFNWSGKAKDDAQLHFVSVAFRISGTGHQGSRCCGCQKVFHLISPVLEHSVCSLGRLGLQIQKGKTCRMGKCLVKSDLFSAAYAA